MKWLLLLPLFFIGCSEGTIELETSEGTIVYTAEDIRSIIEQQQSLRTSYWENKKEFDVELSKLKQRQQLLESRLGLTFVPRTQITESIKKEINGEVVTEMRVTTISEHYKGDKAKTYERLFREVDKKFGGFFYYYLEEGCETTAEKWVEISRYDMNCLIN